MVAEATAAAELGLGSAEVAERLVDLLKRAGLPTGPVRVDMEIAAAALAVDKKKTVCGVKLPVVVEIGRSAVVEGMQVERLVAYLQAVAE